MSSFTLRSAANVTPILVKKPDAKLGTELTGFLLTNKAASARSVKFYDAANAADVMVGTTPPAATVIIPATATLPASKLNILFQLGIVAAVTTLPADSDTTAGSAADVLGQIMFGLPGADR